MRIASLFLIGCLGLASGFKSPRRYAGGSPSEPPSPSSSEALKLRGGAGPLDPALVAKTATAVVGVQGLANVLGANSTLRFYGIASATEDDVSVTRFTGVVQTASATTAGLILSCGTDVTTAIALGFAPFVLWFITGLIFHVPEKWGNDSIDYHAGFLINSFAMYGLLKGTDWADKVFKGVLSLNSIIYLIGRLNPDVIYLLDRLSPANSAKVWGRETPISAYSEIAIKNIGAFGLALCTMAYHLNSGTDALTSIGYGWAVTAATLAYSLFLSDDFEALETVSTLPFHAWLILSLAVVGTLVA